MPRDGLNISVAIMAHPSRAGLVDALRADHGWGDVAVAFDDEGKPSRDPARIWRTARRAWSMFDPGPSHHLVVQDDASVSVGMLDALSRAVRHVPADSPISLYVGGGRPLQGKWTALARCADDVGASWIAAERLWWGVAVAVPTRVIPEMLAWCDKRVGLADDQRIGGFFNRAGVPAFYTWPSLVDHGCVPSITGHTDSRRTARRFAPDAAGLQWDGPVVADSPTARRFPAIRDRVITCVDGRRGLSTAARRAR